MSKRNQTAYGLPYTPDRSRNGKWRDGKLQPKYKTKRKKARKQEKKSRARNRR